MPCARDDKPACIPAQQRTSSFPRSLRREQAPGPRRFSGRLSHRPPRGPGSPSRAAIRSSGAPAIPVRSGIARPSSFLCRFAQEYRLLFVSFPETKRSSPCAGQGKPLSFSVPDLNRRLFMPCARDDKPACIPAQQRTSSFPRSLRREQAPGPRRFSGRLGPRPPGGWIAISRRDSKPLRTGNTRATGLGGALARRRAAARRRGAGPQIPSEAQGAASRSAVAQPPSLPRLADRASSPPALCAKERRQGSSLEPWRRIRADPTSTRASLLLCAARLRLGGAPLSPLLPGDARPSPCLLGDAGPCPCPESSPEPLSMTVPERSLAVLRRTALSSWQGRNSPSPRFCSGCRAQGLARSVLDRTCPTASKVSVPRR